MKEVVSYYEKGQIREKKFLRDGKIHGEYTSYFGNGQVMARLHFEAGIRNGEAVTYYKHGQLREKATFQNDKFDGPYTSFYDNGQEREQEGESGRKRARGAKMRA